MRAKDFITEQWTQKYKKSINCSHPKGFSQKAHCAGKKKHNEDMSMEAVCPDCGMCQTHGNLNEIAKGAKDSNGFTKCWPGKHAEGTKKGKNGGQVRNCVPNESVAEGVDIGQEWMSDTELDQYVPERLQQQWRELLGYDRNGNPSALWANLTGGYEPDVNDPQHRRLMVKVANKWFTAKKIPNVKFFNVKDADDELEWLVQIGQQGVAEDWNKVNHHDKTNGLSQKAVNAYRREHPGSKLQTAVTTKPSKLKPGSKAAKRRKSFCARMSGNKGPMKTDSGKPTPKALALRRWHCESLDELYITANQRIYEAEGDEEGLKHLTPHLARDILDQMEKEGVHAIVKSIEWGDGGAEELIAMIKHDLQRVAGRTDERMLPASSFTGSKKNKINGKGMLRNGPAKAGDLVGGG
jgi:hypothetical protein